MDTTYDYRYTDRDVREDSRLVDLACAYLKTYGGDFEPLIEAKTYLRIVGEPPTAMIRKVLNCMRHDNNMAGRMPVPHRPSYDIEDVVAPPERVRKNAVVQRSRYPFDLKTTWKKRIYAATTKHATAYHYLSPLASVIRYWPVVGKYRVMPKAWCGVTLSTGVLLNEAPDGRHECRQCVRMMQEQALREEQRRAEEHRMTSCICAKTNRRAGPNTSAKALVVNEQCPVHKKETE